MWLFLWLPLAFYLFVYAAGFLLDHETYRRFFIGESGFPDLSQVPVLIAAIIMGIRAIRDAHVLQIRFLRGWLFLGTLGCIYFLGETTTWGQVYFHWETSEAWKEFNDQNETNLHNSARYGFFFDQLPRALLTLGALVGGIVVPLYLKLRGQSLNPARLWYWIWPTLVALPAAMFVVFLARIDRVIGAFVGHDWPFFDMRTGSLKESMCAYFLLVYLASLAGRLRQLRDANHPWP